MIDAYLFSAHLRALGDFEDRDVCDGRAAKNYARPYDEFSFLRSDGQYQILLSASARYTALIQLSLLIQNAI